MEIDKSFTYRVDMGEGEGYQMATVTLLMEGDRVAGEYKLPLPGYSQGHGAYMYADGAIKSFEYTPGEPGEMAVSYLTPRGDGRMTLQADNKNLTNEAYNPRELVESWIQVAMLLRMNSGVYLLGQEMVVTDTGEEIYRVPFDQFLAEYNTDGRSFTKPPSNHLIWSKDEGRVLFLGENMELLDVRDWAVENAEDVFGWAVDNQLRNMLKMVPSDRRVAVAQRVYKDWLADQINNHPFFVVEESKGGGTSPEIRASKTAIEEGWSLAQAKKAGAEVSGVKVEVEIPVLRFYKENQKVGKKKLGYKEMAVVFSNMREREAELNGSDVADKLAAAGADVDRLIKVLVDAEML